MVAPNAKDRFARSDDWIRILKEKRDEFYKLKAQHFVKPPDDDADPLAATTSQNTHWDQYFKDQDLRQQIGKDTARTFQELEFFQNKEILRTLEDILFLFCRTHPNYGYPQGLHELAALILYVYHSEMTTDETDTLGFIFNRNAIIPDTFWTFSALAEAVEKLYGASNDSDSFCITMANYIQTTLISKHNPALAKSLQNSGIAPQSYMLSWLRLLFLRAFEMEQVINMWDIIIAHLPNLDIISHTCVAMLLDQASQLITDDSIQILQLLYHYPKPKNAVRFVYRAVELMNTQTKKGREDISMMIAERLNELARGLESVCQGKGFESAIPYIMDLRRARDVLLGLLDIDEMLPLEQAVELFKPAAVEMTAVVEEKEQKPDEKPLEVELPKAASTGNSKVSTDLLFDEEDIVVKKKTKKPLKKKSNASSLFD